MFSALAAALLAVVVDSCSFWSGFLAASSGSAWNKATGMAFHKAPGSRPKSITSTLLSQNLRRRDVKSRNIASKLHPRHGVSWQGQGTLQPSIESFLYTWAS